MWKECSTGGGEGIKGNENGGPPTLCQPASQQGGGEEVKTWQEEPGGGWRCAGAQGKIFGLSFHFHTRSLFSITCEPGIGGSAQYQFLAELNGRRCLHESESFVVSIVCLLSFIVSA